VNVFGQVWLWSLLAFVAGVALTWLVMVRPARRHVADLEDQLLDARRSAPPIATTLRDDDFEVDEWDDTPPRSLGDEVLALPAPAPAPFPAPAPAPAPAPYVEPPAYFGEPVAPPVVAEEPEPVVEEPVVEEPVVQEPVTPVRQYMEADEAQRRFEEQLAEQRAQAEAEDDDRPRSLFERLSPENVPEETPAEMTTVLPRSGLEAADFDYEDEPELPAEQTGFIPAVVEPTAEVAPPAQEPTAPAEVDEQVDDFIYQPREVWAEQEQESFLDEAAEQEDEPARQEFEQQEPEQREFTASEQTTFIAVEESSWPANDLTGEYPGLRDEISGQLDAVAEPESPAEQTMIEPLDLDAPHVRNGVFETTLAEEPGFTEPEPESEPAHARREPLEPEVLEPVEYTEAEEEPAGYVEPVGYVQPFSTPGAPAPAPFAAFGAPPETELETTGRQPRAVAAAFDHVVEAPPQAPAAPAADHPRSLFEPLLDADEPLPALGQTRQLPDTSHDQPFVPKFVPSDEPLLAAPPEPEPEPVEVDLPQRTTEAGLPIREARRTTQQRQQSFSAFAAFEQPKPEPAPPAPAAALPARPRPVGFSPSTGGRPNGATAPGSARFQQPEGFNPRSPFGPGSVLPKSDGLAPAADFSVKATLTGRRYYTEGSANFGGTRADVWFRTEADAEKAGFRPAP
jgi:hypothetical protein